MLAAFRERLCVAAGNASRVRSMNLVVSPKLWTRPNPASDRVGRTRTTLLLSWTSEFEDLLAKLKCLSPATHMDENTKLEITTMNVGRF